MHYFLAIPLPNEVKQQLHAFISEWKAPFRLFVHEADYHITLAFLGRATETERKQIAALMPDVIQRHRVFSLQLSEVYSFGSRILWYGVKEEPCLFSLRQDVYDVCRQIGFSLDARPFTPHITLAKNGTDRFRSHLKHIRERLKERTFAFSYTTLCYTKHIWIKRRNISR